MLETVSCFDPPEAADIKLNYITDCNDIRGSYHHIKHSFLRFFDELKERSLQPIHRVHKLKLSLKKIFNLCKS